MRAVRKGAAKGSWLARMLAEKPRLWWRSPWPNKMARSIWAMLSKGEDYRGSPLAPAFIARDLESCQAILIKKIELDPGFRTIG